MDENGQNQINLNNQKRQKVLQDLYGAFNTLETVISSLSQYPNLLSKTERFNGKILNIIAQVKQEQVIESESLSERGVLFSIEMTEEIIKFLRKYIYLLTTAKSNLEKVQDIQNEIDNEIDKFEQKQQEIVDRYPGFEDFGSKKKHFTMPFLLIREKALEYRRHTEL